MRPAAAALLILRAKNSSGGGLPENNRRRKGRCPLCCDRADRADRPCGRPFERERGQIVVANIVIVEGEQCVADVVKAAFEREGHYCVTVCDGLDAVDAIVEADFDLAVLGLGLTGIDSIQLLEYIRTLDIPTIMVLDASQEKECLHCMEIGASACIIKPFSVRELLSCANKFLERGALRETLRMGTTEIDTTARQVRIAGCEVVLSPKEYDLLMLFVRNPHRAFSREDIYERVWHGYYPSKSKAVDIAVARLRKKMGWDAEIKAIRKFGYRFDPPSMG